MYALKLSVWEIFPSLFPFPFAFLFIKTLYNVKIKCYNSF
jgi:hypothetical protein